jgi:hypothetical protein
MLEKYRRSNAINAADGLLRLSHCQKNLTDSVHVAFHAFPLAKKLFLAITHRTITGRGGFALGYQRLPFNVAGRIPGPHALLHVGLCHWGDFFPQVPAGITQAFMLRLQVGTFGTLADQRSRPMNLAAPRGALF